MDFNGKNLLFELAKRAGYNDKFELVAAHTLFVHPKTVDETNNKNLFRVIRDFPNRGKIINYNGKELMCCDNTGPQHAIEWSIGGMKKTDIQINHIYSDSKNVEIYTSLSNLCATPTFIAKLTDTDKEIIELLKYRSFDLYGFYLNHVPTKPERYSSLNWMAFPPPIDHLERFLRKRLDECKKSRTAVSAKKLGWYFSDFEPDLTIKR